MPVGNLSDQSPLPHEWGWWWRSNRSGEDLITWFNAWFECNDGNDAYEPFCVWTILLQHLVFIFCHLIQWHSDTLKFQIFWDHCIWSKMFFYSMIFERNRLDVSSRWYMVPLICLSWQLCSQSAGVAHPDIAALDVFLGQHILLTLEQHFNPKI